MKNFKYLAIACGILGLASASNAQSLQFTGMQLSNANTGVVSIFGSTENVYMGALTFSDGVGTIVTYCADLQAPLNGSNNPYSVGLVNQTDGSGLASAAKILGNYFYAATSPDEQQGLQLAIWEALYDNGATSDFSTGNLQIVGGVNATALAFATSFYSASTNSGASINLVELFTSQGAGGQSQIHVVPEPTSMAVLGLGALALIRRRRASKN